MSTDNLPDGWTRARFGDVVRNCNENSRDLAADGIDRVVGLDHLDPGSLRLARWDNLADLPDGTTFARKFKPGQVLFGKRRAYQRKVAVADFEGVCSGDILVFEPADKRMHSEFLPYVVQSDGFFDHALGTSAGSLSPRTKWAELAKYEFALPPIDEQRRIITVMRAADRVVDGHSVAQAAARSALAAVLSPLFTGASLPLGDALIESPRNGLTIAPVDRETGTWSLTVGSVDEAGYCEGGLKPVANSDVGAFVARPGDLFITRSNTLERVGLAFRFPGASETVVYSDLLMRLRPNTTVIRPAVLEAFLRSSVARRFIRSIAAGTSASMKKINGTNLCRMPIPKLDESAQEMVEGLVTAFQETSASLYRAANDASSVRKSLLKALLQEPN